MTEHRRPPGSIRPGFAEADWDARYAQKELVWTAEPNRRFAAEVDGLAPGRALDVACGEGRNAVWLAERGWRVTAVDLSSVGLAKARDLAAARGVEVDLVHADVLAWDPERAPLTIADPLEVESAHRVPTAELADPATRCRVRHPSGYTGPGFEVRGMLVWGFTGGLVDRVLRLTGWEQPWDAGRVVALPEPTPAAFEPQAVRP